MPYLLTGGLDFSGISSQMLVFSPTINTVTVPIDINDDNFLELPTEIFTANLMSTVPRLSLSPVEAMVNINDDDRECSSVTS